MNMSGYAEEDSRIKVLSILQRNKLDDSTIAFFTSLPKMGTERNAQKRMDRVRSSIEKAVRENKDSMINALIDKVSMQATVGGAHIGNEEFMDTLSSSIGQQQLFQLVKSLRRTSKGLQIEILLKDLIEDLSEKVKKTRIELLEQDWSKEENILPLILTSEILSMADKVASTLSSELSVSSLSIDRSVLDVMLYAPLFLIASLIAFWRGKLDIDGLERNISRVEASLLGVSDKLEVASAQMAA